MKALKLKSSTKENPVWGYTTCDSFSNWKWDTIGITKKPTIFNDYITIDQMRGDRDHLFYLFDQWELVTVKITIE